MELLSFLGLVFIGVITFFIPRTVVACIGMYFLHGNLLAVFIWVVLIVIAFVVDVSDAFK
ncbi:MAG: hypothetical protein UW46_C0003G0024 [Candidatus Yanofskybacteria bacterium GW2011_GWF1_44_227]|uniref:Uncharacterized protein n=1 Tax=Candidatus Yanofskybacteria bacterium GW2011_GWE2_40_11 TaxID=1619033 RepID=A0A0G0QV33_9BACT|nr:MAG: hypothetical protein UT69_C0008G0033 [Candidatus Yanofskybacteria bacterium GW2011_GWE1_40_10]KKR41216.1 MAG: hypothetical protein UT75_C0001G0120 [Candidatus Yanofskybacteria bacterium GW2011_GWE2_40_11]KKT15709.1 MAG: hypothetical protein UV97_C0003G0041 [Candidatus Yanofskybacteria bacterium GW2011_GWF2_43_596]KKT53403.1 MAG: hypothetical protein UW46_C0003G0024 [Candidatus Yanofskybacteria bacterium GW2011_GWF1_44_227]